MCAREKSSPPSLKTKVTHSFRDFIDLVIKKIAIIVEVLFPEGAFPDDLVRDLSLDVHEKFQHLIVRLPGEHDSPGVKFVNRARGRPHVDAVVVGNSEYYFRRSVKPRHQVGGYFVVVYVRRRSKITQFEYQLTFVYQYIVRFDI